MPVPMLPYAKHACPSLPTEEQNKVCQEYLHQVSCQDCHHDADVALEEVVI